MLQINQKLLDHIKKWEGLRLEAYDDLQPNKKITNKNQVKGTLTIGYGHTKNVKVGQKITESEAENLLREDLQVYVNTVLESVKVEINENMFIALVSLCYNIGQSAFKNSTLLKNLNNNLFQETANAFLQWNKSSGKVLEGLTNRRKDESTLFMTGFGVLKMFNPALNTNQINWFIPVIAIIVIFSLFR